MSTTEDFLDAFEENMKSSLVSLDQTTNPIRMLSLRLAMLEEKIKEIGEKINAIESEGS